jgi:hypothetical protein
VRNSRVTSKPDAASFSMCAAVFYPLQRDAAAWPLLTQNLFCSHSPDGAQVV